MALTKFILRKVRLPLKFAFKTAKTTLFTREILILEVQDDSGQSGYGECVAFSEPFYTSETQEMALTTLQNLDLSAISALWESNQLEDLASLFPEKLPMTQASLEMALLDLKTRKAGTNLVESFFPQETLASHVFAGSVLGEMPEAELLKQTAILVEQGIHRIKFKISPTTNLKILKAIRNTYPDLQLAVDANQSFSDYRKLLTLDELSLACIEEALAPVAWQDYAPLSAQLKTPLCFDERVLRLSDLQTLRQELPNPIWVNLKIGRLGGLYATREIIAYCKKENIPFWVGSMVESGLSKSLHLQLSALPGNAMPGDFADSAHYFEEDLITPPIQFSAGNLKRPDGAGLGVTPNRKALENNTTAIYTRLFD
ncbi:MAG: o-succinylbenzoate synthase [Streptococcaceae bacterium]|jgi:O-succinylbenzoate synthase|nr:o-succinylbenzoate synthase [Streptococcaceae bacterium]